MKRLRLNVDSILPSLNLASSVILSKNTMPILFCILFESRMEDGHLILDITGSDGETWLTLKVVEGISGDEGISICLDSSDIFKSLRGLTGDEVDMCIDEEKKKITCKYSNGKFAMPYSDAGEYPKARYIQGGTMFRVNSELLKNAIHFVDYAAATDELRPVLTGIYMSMSYKTGFSAVATDGRVLAKYNDSLAPCDTGFENAFILPRKAANLLYMVVGGTSNTEDICVRSTGENADFSTSDFKMVSRLIDGNYPNYEAVIPKQFAMNGSFVKSELIAAIRRVLPLGDDSSKMLKFTFGIDEVTIKAEDLELSTEASEIVVCDYRDEELSIGLNGDSLLSLMKRFDEEVVDVRMNAQHKPAIFESVKNPGNGITKMTLLMPMRI